jgi:hypothetical protein
MLMDDLIDYTSDPVLRENEMHALRDTYAGDDLMRDFRDVLNSAFNNHHKLSLLRRDFFVNQNKYKTHIENKLRLSGSPHPNNRIIDEYNQAIDNHYNRIRNNLNEQNHLHEMIFYQRPHEIVPHQTIADLMLPLTRSQLIHDNRFFASADDYNGFKQDVDNLIESKWKNTNKLKFVQNREIGKK